MRAPTASCGKNNHLQLVKTTYDVINRKECVDVGKYRSAKCMIIPYYWEYY